MAHLLKEGVVCVSEHLEDAHYVLGGGYLLQTVVWPTEDTYDDVCDEYIAYINNQYGQHVTCVFDGYGDPSSTKNYEQDRRVNGNLAPDIIFTRDTSLSRYQQKEFLNNRRNKTEFISLIETIFHIAGIACSQSQCDADYLTASTALAIADNAHIPVVLVGTDTDLLILLVANASIDQYIYMQFNSEQLYKIKDMQAKLATSVKSHILIAHAITGCDTVSTLYSMGKKKIVTVLSDNDKDYSFLDVFKKFDATKDEVAHAGEKLFLALYGTNGSDDSLNKLRYTFYCKQLAKKCLTSQEGFQLQKLPLTSDAAKYHSYRAYLQVQQWQGSPDIIPTYWGWCFNDGIILPITMDSEVAPGRILKHINCGCKQGCREKCKCRSNGLKCTNLCSGCNGTSCSNSDTDIDDVWSSIGHVASTCYE